MSTRFCGYVYGEYVGCVTYLGFSLIRVKREGSSKIGNFCDDSVAGLHATVSGKCVILTMSSTHVAGQSKDRY